APPPSVPLALHDALPISRRHDWDLFPRQRLAAVVAEGVCPIVLLAAGRAEPDPGQSSELPLVGLQLLPKAVHILQDLLDVLAVRSEEHTSELQSRFDLVC